MANIINLKQINGPSNDTLIIKKVKAANEVQSATNAQVAKVVQYASTDYSKGTIDQRLNALGG